MAAFTALALGSLAFGAYNQIRAGQSAKKAGEAERRAAEASADLAEYNAAVADLQATDAVARGAEDESRFRTTVRGLIGSQRAGISAGDGGGGWGAGGGGAAGAGGLGGAG